MILTLKDVCEWDEITSIIQAKFGDKGTSKPSLKRLLKSIESIDLINFARCFLKDGRWFPTTKVGLVRLKQATSHGPIS